MNNTTKKRIWEEGLDALECLVAWDFKVQPFSAIHFRVNDRLDLWPSTRKWYDTKSHRKGSWEGDLEEFVKSYLKTEGGFLSGGSQ